MRRCGGALAAVARQRRLRRFWGGESAQGGERGKHEREMGREREKKASEGTSERREKAAVVRCGGGAQKARQCSGTAVVGKGFGSNRGGRV